VDKLREHLIDDSRQAKTGVVSGVKRLSSDAAATTAELREFVRSLKGRSPQEVMGIVASNALTQAMIVSTIATVVLIGALTIVPYALSGSPKGKSTKAMTSTNAAESESAKANDSTRAANASDTPSEDDIKKASKAMGLDETKTADPNKNPLDNFDNLLDKVK
jgi:hypothetical protein